MVKVNGKKLDFSGKTVAELIAAEGYDPTKTAVELNGDIVPKANYASTVLNDGDSVEIVGFVGGG